MPVGLCVQIVVLAQLLKAFPFHTQPEWEQVARRWELRRGGIKQEERIKEGFEVEHCVNLCSGLAVFKLQRWGDAWMEGCQDWERRPQDEGLMSWGDAVISGTMRQNDYRCMSRKQAMETIDWGKYKLITLAFYFRGRTRWHYTTVNLSFSTSLTFPVSLTTHLFLNWEISLLMNWWSNNLFFGFNDLSVL